MERSPGEQPATPSAAGERPAALLLLGPTGSGKTPLGEAIQRRGLWGRSWVHFDFGSQLRAVVSENRPNPWLSAADVEFLRQVLQSGALLEDRQFYLAEGVLRSFLDRQPRQWPADVVLNGLPRHEGQANDVQRIVDVRWVIALNCTAENVLARIHHDTGGDRAARSDDHPDDVLRRLATYAQRTAPLIEHYRRLGAQVTTIEVTPTMSAKDLWQAAERAR